MNINLPPDQQAFIESLVQSGRFASADDAISECIGLLVSREQLRNKIAEGVEQANRGDVINHDTMFADLRTKAANMQ
jgi:antitoxin ParD1/3/4